VLIDTHCHLTSPRFAGDLDAVIDHAATAGIGRMITIGTGVDDAEAGAALATRYPGRVLCAAGLDPFTCHERHAGFAAELDRLALHLGARGCVALGEVGLEYHHPLLPPAAQAECLTAQLALAHDFGLPVILHCRDGHADLLRILASWAPLRGCVHSFSADAAAAAAAYVGLGLHLAFNGMITFPRTSALQEAVATVPADRLLLETDSPYLAPVPHRGRRCEPGWLVDICRTVAGIRGSEPAVVAAVTTRNAEELFGL
jgi:TatD DNase family protein